MIQFIVYGSKGPSPKTHRSIAELAAGILNWRGEKGTSWRGNPPHSG